MKNFLQFILNLISGRGLFVKPVVVPTPEPQKPPVQPVVVLPPPPEPVVTPTERLYNIALSWLGRDVTPADKVDDDVACMETFDTLFKETFGTYINGTKNKITISTLRAGEIFKSNPKRFRKVIAPKPGVIILAATGSGTGVIPNGHVGIFYSPTGIMSNDSATGLFKKNFTLEGWLDRYKRRGGYPTLMYEVI